MQMKKIQYYYSSPAIKCISPIPNAKTDTYTYTIHANIVHINDNNIYTQIY